MSSKKYCKEAICNVKKWLDERGRALMSRAVSVFPFGYQTELDSISYCNDDKIQYL
jgi:hypothetical protein